MLKALEIVGFKSFADKTRFDFPPGITVVVGPNGSGKSNVVDAIKWVLGEQSAKSLRGKDMSDVIFKGSGTDKGRRAANTAEATIILDNADHRLDHESEEVHITRRVYRSGEGEYSINGEICRLKDIRDLFRGTGIGTDAYSLIEQGKVDRLLQASTKERRAIFEEAAGISRFKAKKVEAQRRLARVDQNLLRLSDIVDEVGSRYRSVKAQASKASRYKEFSDRLRQLRIESSFLDWTANSETIEKLQYEDGELHQKLSESEARLQEVDKELAESQTEINQFSDTLLDLEGQASRIRESIAKLDNVIESEGKRKLELQERQRVLDVQIGELRLRIESLESRHEELLADKTKIANSIAEQSEQLESVKKELSDLRSKQEKIQDQETEIVAKQKDLEQLWADQQRRSFELETEINSLRKSCEQEQETLDQLTNEIQACSVELADLEVAEQKLEEETAAKDVALANARNNLSRTREKLAQLNSELQELRTEKNGMTQRAKVIEELEKKLEGIQSGARFILDRARTENPGPFRNVHGLVADLIQVQVQHATLIDGILGERSQYVVCNGPELSSWLESNEAEIAGRVGIYRLDRLPQLTPDYDLDLSGLPHVVGRADQVVTVESSFQALIDYLLANVWIVQGLRDAFRLQAEKSNRVRYVTLKGEIVEPDGVLILGPPSSPMSLISRRSELRSLKKRLIDLGKTQSELDVQVKNLEEQVAVGESEVERLLQEHTQVARQLSEHQLRRETLESRVAELKKQRDTSKDYLADYLSQKSDSESRMEKLTGEMTNSDAELQETVQLRAALAERQQAAQEQLDQLHQQNNELNLHLATEQQQLESSENAIQQAEQTLGETSNILNQSEAETAANQERLDTSAQQISDAIQNRDGETAAQQSLTQKIVEHSDKRKQVVSRRDQLQRSSIELSQDLKTWQNRKHGIELELGQIQGQKSVIEERLRDDYGLELSEISERNIDFVIEDRQAAENEINELRRKITSIGAVNTDALQELEDLEGRYLSLEEQYQDLVNAKESLERIIVRINSDSRRIFVETLEAIRKNFQALYRRNFGGGKADIVLEEGVDELEAGIDIIATPPGKAEFSNSLLSGGEKALTAVSLLLAIFQFRPSPFCVLDEVDAPFDEANIGRFVEVLKSFLSWTRFVVVTHSKKTMTAADTLYGVTMLESGISTKVSVRFEDVDEKGNISKTAVEKSQADKPNNDIGVA